MTVRRAAGALLATVMTATLCCSLGASPAQATTQGVTHLTPQAAAPAPVATWAQSKTQSKAQAKPKRKFAKPGKYKGNFYTDKGKKLEPFTFRVSKNGRRLTKFSAYLDVICSYYPPTVETHPMGFPKTKIKKNHTFKRVWKPNKKSRIMLKGKFKGKRLISGRINYEVGICVRTGSLKAKRVGK